MAEKFILAIDQGTTGSTVLAVSPTLRVLGKRNQEFPQIFPKPGWVEHKGSDIWSSISVAAKALFEEEGLDPKNCGAIGITNQRETTCVFDAQSEPVHNFIVWQCKRTADICQAMKTKGLEPMFKKRTGLVLDPYFSGTKLKWVLDNVDGVRARAERGELHFGTIDTWLVHKLTAGKVHVTDATNASRTLMMDLQTGAWAPDLCASLNVPLDMLPEIRSSSEVYGHTENVDFLPDGIPVCGIAGDQQAALFGQACFSAGEAKCTYGTGCFLLMNTGTEIVHSQNGLLTTVAIQLGDTMHYALEGAAFIGGAAVQWLRDGVKMIESAEDIERLARSVDDTGDVVFVPALAGLGAPHWRPDAKGVLMGLSRDTHRGHLARAVLEGIAMQNRDILVAMQKDAGPLAVVKVDGGAAKNDLLMQHQADVLDTPCIRPEVIETTALGAAALAGLAVGVFSHPDEVKKVWRQERVFTPNMSDADRNLHIAKWARAVAAC